MEYRNRGINGRGEKDDDKRKSFRRNKRQRKVNRRDARSDGERERAEGSITGGSARYVKYYSEQDS